METTKTMNRLKPLALAAMMGMTSLALTGCGSDDDSNSSPADPSAIAKSFDCTDDTTQGARVICIGSANDLSDAAIQEELLSAVATAQTGDTFVFPAGRYNLTSTIEFNGLVDNQAVTNLTFRGAGKDQTIFDVSGASGDGFLFNNTDYLIFEDFGIYESNNNALKVTKSTGVIMRRMATVWETDYQSTNGAYGLYPVETEEVLIEDSYVKGSADAGVYVGQSHNIVVRNNIAEKNVAGIEIENSTNADVYGNVATGNTGGILIFDLPIGNGKYGSGVRIFDNEVTANNAPNFANVGSFAGGVHIVPPGTGVIVLSTSDVEIYNNTITDHQTTSFAITSYMLPDDQVAATPEQDVGGADNDDATKAVLSYGDIHPYAEVFMDGWSPFVRNINIRDNVISVAAGINNPEGSLIEDIITGYEFFHAFYPGVAAGKTTIPHILYDGVGELLANVGAMYNLADGINQVAAGVKANIPGAADYTEIELAKFAPYNNDGVCQSGNGIDGQTLFAASVFQTQAADAAQALANGTPKAKVELYRIHTDLVGEVMTDNTMTCGEGIAYEGNAVTVTFGENTYGCGAGADDENLAACAL